MAFDAQQRKIYDILSGDFKYVVPRYQRKYVWEEKQWQELLDDLKYCLDAENEQEINTDWSHFLGSFVFEKEQKSMTIIDGQQRMTTIIIMLCAVCVLFNEMGDKDRFKGVTKYILGTDDLGKDFSRVDNNDLENFKVLVAESTDYNDLQSKSQLFNSSYLVTSPKDNINVKNCFIFFYTQFQDLIQDSGNPKETLARIKEKIIGLDVIDIKATNQQESYNIFEILNARGVDLKQHELIKNYIFKYLRPKASIDTAKYKWDKIDNMLFINKKSLMEMFFTHYVTHKYDKPSLDNTEFRIIKAKCPKNEMPRLLDDLYEKALIYRWFYLPQECNNEMFRIALSFFSDNNHRQFRPIFLSIISAYNKNRINIKTAEKFFRFMQNFYFGYGIVCGGKSNYIEEMVYSYARKIENEFTDGIIPEFMEKLRRYYPTFDQFQTNFKTLGYSNSVKSYKTASKKKDVQYILGTIEAYYQSSTNELNVKDFSIEHIANDNGMVANCQIGNLLPLAEPINNNAGGAPFLKKLEFYKKSNLLTAQKFVERFEKIEQWTEKEIESRAYHLAELSYNTIWKLD